MTLKKNRSYFDDGNIVEEGVDIVSRVGDKCGHSDGLFITSFGLGETVLAGDDTQITGHHSIRGLWTLR